MAILDALEPNRGIHVSMSTNPRALVRAVAGRNWSFLSAPFSADRQPPNRGSAPYLPRAASGSFIDHHKREATT
jgi:hypothetical protein